MSENSHRPNWTVVAGLVRRGNDLLLVRQQGPQDRTSSWVLPGGKVEAGELLHEALTREIREETGLVVRSVGPLAYLAQLDILYLPSPTVEESQAQSRQLIVFSYEITAWSGRLAPADPDDLILEARFFPLTSAINKFQSLSWRTMREPIVAYLRGDAAPGTTWLYRRQLDKRDQLMARLG